MPRPTKSVLRWNSTDGIINYCNGSFSKKCNAAPDEIIGKHINQLNQDNGIQIKHLNDLKLIPGEPQTDTLLWLNKDGSQHSEIATIQALIKDGQNVTEIQISGLEDEQEHNFRITLDSLLEVVSDNNSINSVKTQRILDIGLDYFSMQGGAIGSAMGDSLELICVCGTLAKIYKPTDKIPLSGSMCSEVLDSDNVVAVNNIPKSKFSKVSHDTYVDLHCYIGTQILSSNGPLGTISFFSNAKRKFAFTQQDIRLISLMANWIGTIIGNEEQIEFASFQHDYYQSLFRTVPAMMMLCNHEGIILSTSDRLAHKLGISSQCIPGMSCHQLFDQSNKADIDQALAADNINKLPLTLRYNDGDTLDIELNSRIKLIGSMQGVRMMVLTDVSERNQAIKSVKEQNKKLALVNQSLNQFAVIASHDLQEPLRKIQQFCGFMHEDLDDCINDEGRYHLDVIVNSTKQMTTLVQDLLDFSSAAKGELELHEINLNELLSEVCSEQELRISESNAQITIAKLPTIQGDRSLVRQLFTNLVSNSIKYRDENRAPIIQIDSLRNDDTLTLTISDNGIGFDQQLTTRAFEPFNRLHNDKKYKGNGIGLSICATVCDKHNWKLSASSCPGAGSVFAIEISNT